MSAPHEPSEEFRSHLEWQIRTELRRRDRFPPPDHRWRYARIASLIIIPALLGAGGIVTADLVQGWERRALLLEEAHLRVAMAEAAVTVLETQEKEMVRLHGAGAVTSDERRRVAGRLADARVDLDLLRLDLEEIGVTGREPDDDLSAPMAGGRDWVGDRLRLRIARGDDRLHGLREKAKRYETLFEAGGIGPSEIQGALVELERAQNDVDTLRERLRLRERFLHGAISGARADREGDRVEGVRALTVVQRRLEGHREEVARMRKLHAMGGVTTPDLQDAERAVREAETDLRIAEIRLQLIDGDARRR